MLFRYAAAEVDCTTAISLDPTYVKVYSRRGTARFKLQKLEDAKKDFQHVLKLEPRNRQAQTELRKINEVGMHIHQWVRLHRVSATPLRLT